MAAKKKPEEQATNLQALDKLITGRATSQAHTEWEDFLDMIREWIDEHEVAPFGCTIHGGHTAKSLSANLRSKGCQEAHDAVRGMCTGVNGLAKHFITARTEALADKMAAALVEKANILS